MSKHIRNGLALVLMATVGATALAACKDEALTREEAKEALEEAQLSTQAQSLTMDVLEISTDFTIGAAVEDAAEEMRAFIASQVPCSTVSRDKAVVTVDFGQLDDDCEFKGRTYAGIATIEVARTEEANLEVIHTWDNITDGNVTLEGGASVTWSRAELSRRVVHQVVWRKGDRSATAEGDRTQTLVDRDAGLKGGIEINGGRAWTSDKGRWRLAIAGVQIRGQDPVPQAGTYTLTTPKDKKATLTFTRLDETTIEVKVAGARKDFKFNVRSVQR